MEMQLVKEEDSLADGGFFGETGVTKHPEAERAAVSNNAAAAGGTLDVASEEARRAAAEQKPATVLQPTYAVNKGPVPAPVPPAIRRSKAGGAVKTKVEPVDVAYIKALEARGPRLPSFPHGIPESFLLCPAQSLAEQEFRDATAELAAASKAIYDHKMAILEQYRMYGYANEEVEIDDE